MTSSNEIQAILAQDIPVRKKASNYPVAIQQMLATKLQGREKQALGDFFGLSNFGVNLTRLAPQAASALCHRHSRQDEFIYILSGRPTLQTQDGRLQLCAGMCMGFKAGNGLAHCLINETDEEVIYLEIGDRTDGDEVDYPHDDLQACMQQGQWAFFHKDGMAY